MEAHFLQQHKKKIILTLIFAIVVVWVLLLLFVFKAFHLENTSSKTTPSQTSTNLKKYTDKTYGFSFSYPNTWQLQLFSSSPQAKNSNDICYSHGSTVLLTTENHNSIRFSYDNTCSLSSPIPVEKTIPVSLQNTPFLQAYTNVCGDKSNTPGNCATLPAILYTADIKAKNSVTVPTKLNNKSFMLILYVTTPHAYADIAVQHDILSLNNLVTSLQFPPEATGSK